MNNKIYDQFVAALRSNGLSKNEAVLVVAEYIEADKVGQHSHGLSAFPNLLKRLKERGGPVKVIKNKGSTIFLDGNKELGQLAAEKATKLATEKAKRFGIGLVGLKNILPFMRPGTYAKKLADSKLVGIVMIDGGSAMMTHPDSPESVIGTNPIAFSIPTGRGSLVVDMATSKSAWSKVRRALKNGTKLPPGTYKDKTGKFTTDPKNAYSVVPFGDYKGFALGMLVEILCNGLLGMTMGKHKKTANRVAASRGAIFIAIDPARFGSIKNFKNATTKFLKEIEKSKRNPGIKKIRIPGKSSLKK